MFRLTKEERKFLRNATHKRAGAQRAVEVFRSGKWLTGSVSVPLLAVSGAYVLTEQELQVEDKATKLGIPKSRWLRS